MGKCLQKIAFKKKFFFKYFFISLILMVLACFITKFFGNHLYNMTTHFFDISRNEYDLCVVYCMSAWKILILQFALAPAIALCWCGKHSELDEDTNIEYDRRNY